jgi:hypothetical protein
LRSIIHRESINEIYRKPDALPLLKYSNTSSLLLNDKASLKKHLHLSPKLKPRRMKIKVDLRPLLARFDTVTVNLEGLL